MRRCEGEPGESRFPALRTQRKVENMPCKRTRTCSNLTQAMQEAANDMAGFVT